MKISINALVCVFCMAFVVTLTGCGSDTKGSGKDGPPMTAPSANPQNKKTTMD